MFKRFLQDRMPKTSFFLFGPRQVGKSTILKAKNPDLVIDLLDPELQLTYNKNPNLLQQQLSDISTETSKTILIDEIQRVPKLLDIVHSAK